MKNAALLSLFLAACASAPPAAPAVPQWDVIPPGVVEILCQRLQSDAIATGSLAIVKVTQPLATPDTIAAIAGSSARRNKPPATIGPITNRAIPIAIGRGSCNWNPIDVRTTSRHADAMIVELSAPISNPFSRGEAGIIVRVSLTQDHQTWYWIPLVQQGPVWSAGRVYVLFK